MNEFEGKLMEYSDRFNDSFPVFAMRGAEEEEIIAAIEVCLQSGKPYAPGYDPDADY